MSGTITLVQIVNAIARTLGGATTAVKRVQSSGIKQQETSCSGVCLGPITEGVNDNGTLQVYWDTSGTVDSQGDTSKTTFSKTNGTIQYDFTIIADLYISRRNHLSENIYDQTCAFDALQAIFDAQDCGGNFGLSGIRNFQYIIERATFPNTSDLYAGLRCTIQVRVF